MVRSWRRGQHQAHTFPCNFFQQRKSFWARKNGFLQHQVPSVLLGHGRWAQLSVGAPSRVGRAAVKKYLEGSQATEVCLRRCEMCFGRRRVDTAPG